MLTLTIYCFRKKVNILGKVLVCVYFAISVMSVYSIYLAKIPKMIELAENTGVLGYIYFSFIIVLFIFPFLTKGNSFSSAKIPVENIDKKYILFLCIYVACTIISITNMAPKAIELIKSGAWSSNYNNTVIGEGVVFTYSNIFQWLATQISGYTGILAILLAFLLLRTKKKKLFLLSVATIVLYIISFFFSAVYSSSRGMIFQLAMKLIVLWLFACRQIGKKTNLVIIIIFGAMGVVALSYVIAVTVSRFSSASSLASIIEYLGESPMRFNNGLGKIDHLTWGGYTIGGLFGKADMSQAVQAWNNGFYTFVGWLYVDWGPVGVVLIGVGMCLLFVNRIRKKVYRISDLLLIFYYYDFLIIGSLVIGPNQILNILMMIVLYILTRVFVDNKRNLPTVTKSRILSNVKTIASR